MKLRGLPYTTKARNLQAIKEETPSPNSTIESTVGDYAWLQNRSSNLYACLSDDSKPPSPESLSKRNNIPICLKITPGVEASAPKPSRALCLRRDEDNLSPPVYCYNDNEAEVESVYLWWSPCDKCGTAWRIFKEMDNDQSWYKLPSERPKIDEVPGEDMTGWLGWTGRTWLDTSVMITPCENPEADCFVSEPFVDNGSGIEKKAVIAVVAFVVTGLVLMAAVCLVRALRDKGSRSGKGGFAAGAAGGGGGGGGC